MDEINRRVMQVITQFDHSKSTFAKAIGVSPPVITHISTGRNKVGLDVAQKILAAFPAVSSEWLILGNGEMMKQEGLRARTAVLNDLNDVESRLKTVSKELAVAMNTLNKIRERVS